MKRCFSILIVSAACLAGQAATDLVAARAALSDGLWQVAERRAQAAQQDQDPAVREAARLVELEALARAGRAPEMLVRLDAWSDLQGEGARYWRAWAERQVGHVDVARKILSEPFREEAYRLLGLRLLARTATEAHDRGTAEDVFAQVAGCCSNRPAERVSNALEWARMLDGFGDGESARRVLERELPEKATGAEADAAYALQACLAARAGAHEQSRGIYARLYLGGTNTAEAAYVEAACALAEGAKPEDARLFLSNACARAVRPDLVRRAGFARAFARLAQPATRAEAVKDIYALVRRYPDAPASCEALLRLADALLVAGDATEAVRVYDLIQKTYPQHTLDAHVLEGRGWALLAAGRGTEAVGMFARVAQITTNETVRARCLFKQGDALVAEGRYAEAAVVYESVPAGDYRLRARFGVADALQRAGQDERASVLFAELYRTGGPLAEEAQLRAAAIKASRGHYGEAVAFYDMLLDAKTRAVIAPKSLERALLGRGRALYRDYRFSAAARDFAAVAELVPARAHEMAFFLALCQYGEGHEAEAAEAVKRLMDEVPDSPLRCDLMLWRAKYDAGHGGLAAARAVFEACATNAFAKPVRALEARVRAARCAVELTDPERVVELARQVSEAWPTVTDPAARSWVAEMLLLQGEALDDLARFDEAVLVLERVMALDVPSALTRRAALLRADSLLAMGADDESRYRQALEAYRTVAQDEQLSSSQRLVVSFKIGRVLEKLRRTDEAMDQYYTNVVTAYWDAVRPGANGAAGTRHAWFDGDARAFFARAVFILADYYEGRGEAAQAVNVLRYLVESGVSEAGAARRRIQRLTREEKRK